MRLKLPTPPPQYDPLYEAQRNRMIEGFSGTTYSKGEDVGVYAPAKLIVPSVDSLEGAVVSKFGVFSDTTTQTAAAVYTPQAVVFNTTDAADGFSRGTPTSRIVAERKGYYDFQFSLQITSGSASNKKIWIWPRLNGVEQYFGITQGWRELDLKVRFQKHIWRALNEDKGWPLCNSIAKHGAENHVCDFVEVVRGKAQAHEIERELIALYKPKLNRTGRR